MRKKFSSHDFGLTLLFTACLLPLSVNGLSVNYLFAIIPIVFLFSGKTLVRPRSDVGLYICACVVIFAAAALYQFDWVKFFDRRTISFALYMTMFALCVVPITERHIESFKLSILIAGLFFSIKSILLFISLGAEAQAFESKDIVGGQRYGFVYILSFWMVWHEKALINSKTTKLALLLILFLGIFLTFSRASLVAFAVSGVVALLYTVASAGIVSIQFMKRLVYGLIFVSAGFYVVNLIAPIIFDFFSVRLIDYIFSGSSSDALANPETSDGTRVFIWSNIFEFVLNNPVTGAGFLGVWVLNLFDGLSGSSHSQYFDALFRLGPLLFLGYMYFLIEIWKYFKKFDVGIFVGFAGVLIYGLFHETFKESHGMFILAMLLAIATQGCKNSGVGRYGYD